ncbi:gamma-glutamylcyclotransferase [Metallosphaera tengchongensis]|uniref:Gamma-glutamylcyclotransferase n=1 Tax=Metallosphaera tengchongensis TaxID=1532350 RepID=A0A6N0NY10_9CREN|nr:gamma-glutamylcyclotransferase [Metallosphaera tengchongensis]QKR00469.1 gamma-glutamylcyclotransferase [Metallosphaera tengchongensis]
MYIFVYGSLRYGFELHHYLRRSRFVGLGYAEGFEMYNLGGYPGVVKGDGRVWGEVYEINQETLARLDQVEGYEGLEDDLYVRETTTVYFDEQRQHKLSGVYLYIYNQPTKEKDQITSGDYSRWIGMPVVTNLFAYAENTNYEVLRERGVREILREINAYLPGYKVVFNVPCKYGVCANLAKDEKGKVCGYVYMMMEDYLNSLDKAEGHLIRYIRKTVKVYDTEGKEYFGVAYASDEGHSEGTPSREYVNLILEGLQRRWKGSCVSTGLVS